MKPIDFKERNVMIAEDQDEYLTLPALKFQTGETVSCWKLNFIERIKVLITGKVWHSVLNFDKPVTPVFLTVRRKSVYSLTTDDKIKSKIVGWLYNRRRGIHLPAYPRIGKYNISFYAMDKDWPSLRIKFNKGSSIIKVIKEGKY